MTVVALFSKRRSGEPMTRVAELRGVGGLGLEGDVHASAASPRQVLIAGADDIQSLGLRDDALRANIIVARADFTSGDVIRVGSLWLRITMRCEVCSRVRVPKTIGAKRGLLARVLADGVVRDGDDVERTGQRLPALPDAWHERVRAIVCAIPEGTIVTYAQLAEAAGVQRSYCRALPTVLRKLDGAPVHRVVSARQLPDEAVAPVSQWSTRMFYERDERLFVGRRAIPH